MSAMREERWRRPGLVGPIILVVAGLILLLANLGLVQVDWWQLWRLWPLILVLVGLDILSRHSRLASVAVALLTLAIVGGLFYVLVARPEPLGSLLAPKPVQVVSHPVSQDLAGAKEVEVDIHMGVGELDLAALQDSTRLLEGDLGYSQRWGAPPYVSYRLEGERGRLSIESRSRGGFIFPFASPNEGDRWQVRLSREVPLTIVLDGGASSSVLDLSRLQLEELRVQGGVGRADITFPAEGRDMSARVAGGVGDLVLRFPESLEGRIILEGGLGSSDLGPRFRSVGNNAYETAGYGSAANRVQVRVEGGIGSVHVR